MMRLALVILLCSSASAAEWRQWRGDNRPALIRTLPAEGLKPLWMSEKILSGNEGGWGSPVVADGKVYLFAHTRTQQGDKQLPERKYPYLADDKRGHLTPEQYIEYEKNRREEDLMRGSFYNFQESLYSFDAATGKPEWKRDVKSVYTRFLQSGTPTVADGRVYVLGAARMARAFDAKSGEIVWEQRLPGEFTDEFMMSSFAVVDGVAVILAGHLMGLDAATGKLLWEGDVSKTRGTHSSPAVWTGGGRALVIANCGGEDTICVEPRTGAELWRVKTSGGQSTPVIVGNRMITLANQRRGGLKAFELSITESKPLWTYQRVADKGSSPLVVGNYVYAQGERRICCVNLETGEEAWSDSLDLGNPQYTSLVAADGKVYYACEGLMWFAADPTDYQLLVEAKIDRSGLLATKAALRKRLNMDELEKTPEGLDKANKLYAQEVGQHGPLACASPAIAGGRLYLRLKSGLACYDLSNRGVAAK